MLAVVAAGQCVAHAGFVQLAKDVFLVLVRDRVAEDDARPELDHVAVGELALLDPLALHEAAVGRFEILHRIAAALAPELRMVPTHARVVQPDVRFHAAADAVLGVVQADHLPQLVAVHAHQQVAIARRGGLRAPQLGEVDDRSALGPLVVILVFVVAAHGIARRMINRSYHGPRQIGSASFPPAVRRGEGDPRGKFPPVASSSGARQPRSGIVTWCTSSGASPDAGRALGR